MDLNALPPLRDIISTYDLRADKSMGQNFLLDLNITYKIANLGGSLKDMDVIEVGPGPGGLTRGLLSHDVQSLTAFEKDRRAIVALSGLIEAAGGKLVVEEADALKVDMQSIGQDGKRAILANLPYNIATPLLVNWLRDIDRKGKDAYNFMALMFQKEVAERIVAPKGSKTYGRLAVVCQYLCHAHMRLTLPPTAFTPAPKVQSSIVVFTPKVFDADAARPSLKMVEKVTQAAFGQRRKMIRSSLKAYAPFMEELGIDPTIRAEELDVQSYVDLAYLAEEKDKIDKS